MLFGARVDAARDRNDVSYIENSANFNPRRTRRRGRGRLPEILSGTAAASGPSGVSGRRIPRLFAAVCRVEGADTGGAAAAQVASRADARRRQLLPEVQDPGPAKDALVSHGAL